MNDQVRLFADRILLPVGEAARDKAFESKELTGFMVAQGNRYRPGGFMVVGRAVNGWEHSIHPTKLSEMALRAEFAARVWSDSCGGSADECPMSWVTEHWSAMPPAYNPAMSAFWRVTRRVVCGLDAAHGDSARWSSHVVWSNLYKLAPKAGGNPDE